jgi:hypothetical protein
MTNDAAVRIRVLRAANYRCGYDVAGGRKCSQPASIVAHPSPIGNAPSLAVCKEHAKAARP